MPRFELRRAGTPDRAGVNPFTKQPMTIAGVPAKNRFWEIERSGAVVTTCEGDIGKPGTRRSRRFASEPLAQEFVDRKCGTQRRRGFAEVGPSQELAGAPASPARVGSAILVEEYFATEDARFLDELLAFSGEDKLKALGERWYRDARPFARAALVAYIDDGCDRPGHKALVKRLFKLAEKDEKDDLMAHFLVAFDRLTRRTISQVGMRWNAVTQTLDPILGLRNVQPVVRRLREGEKSERFSLATRMYLARRAFRYFRRIGHRDVARYGRAIRAALVLYEDTNLAAPERLLDAWGLMHTLYGYSSVVDKAPRGLRPAAGATLADLAPAPYFPDAWKGAFDEIVEMILAAKSRTVRTWGIAWLRASYASSLADMPIERVRRFFVSGDEDVQRFGAELLKSARGLESLPISEWLALLATPSLDALAVVCDVVKKHVTPARLSLAQTIELVCAPAAPVAELGLAWATDKPVANAADLAIACGVARAGVAAVRQKGVAWCAGLVRALPTAPSERVRDLCDARFVDVRAVGLTLLAGEARFKGDLSLWLALTESPYPDVRTFVLAHAAEWQASARPHTLEHVWTSALLAIHGSADAKRRVPRAISERIAREPSEADALLPLLGLALRSVRREERVFGLAAIARASLDNPALREAAARHLPELALSDRVTA